MKYKRSTVIGASAARVFEFHEHPKALAWLQPPWQKTVLVQPPESLEVGTRVVMKVRLGPFWQTIEAEHVAYEPGRMFADRMTRGPFKRWLHHHRIEPIDESTSQLTDDVDFELPFGWVGKLLGRRYAMRNLDRLFDYRHKVTKAACEAGEFPD